MKGLLTILLSLFLVWGFSQSLPNWQPVQNAPMNYYLWYGQKDSVYMYSVKDTFNARYPSVVMRADGTLWKTLGGGAYWYAIGGSIDSTNTYVTHTALNDTLLNYVKIQTQNPTATLTGGFSYEYHPAGTFIQPLSYSGGRLAAGTNIAATSPIVSIVVNSVSESVSGCSTPPCTISGSQNVTVTYNTPTTVSNVVTTSDGKSATATTSFSSYHKRYLGWASASVPTNAEILAAVYQDSIGGTTALTHSLTQLGSAKYLFYVNTSSVTQVFINTFQSTLSFSLNNSITVTNASGANFSYLYTISNNPIGNLTPTLATFQ